MAIMYAIRSVSCGDVCYLIKGEYGNSMGNTSDRSLIVMFDSKDDAQKACHGLIKDYGYFWRL